MNLNRLLRRQKLATAHEILLHDKSEPGKAGFGLMHAHDDALSHVRTPDGQRHYGFSGLVDASETMGLPYQECEEMTALRRAQQQRGIGRRGFLAGMSVTAGLMLAETYAPSYAFAATGTDHTLVVVFLRGGNDGLSNVVPLGDPRYQTMRPGLGLNDTNLLPLPGGRFGLHPAMHRMHLLASKGEYGVVVSTGHKDLSRSHHDKTMRIESGIAEASMHSGWGGRMLISTGATETFRGMTVGDTMAFTLATGTSSTTPVLTSLGSFSVAAPPSDVKAAVLADLRTMYGAAGGPSADTVNTTLDATIAAAQAAAIKPGTGTDGKSLYAVNDQFGARMLDTARMIKSNVGLKLAVVDNGAWDMHGNMGTPGSGYLNGKLDQLDKGLAAFWEDLGPEGRAKTTVVVMSEFGRTGYTNGHNGTDHGYGSCMHVLSTGQSKAVHGVWPGLAESSLNDGDLEILNDYRDGLADILEKKVGIARGSGQMKQILPGYVPGSLGMFV